jgi:hypothetical protein
MMSAGTNACVSSLRFDRWLAGDLDDDAARALEAHVAGCTDCAWRKRAIEGFRAGFEATRPALVRPVAHTAAPRINAGPRLTVIAGGADGGARSEPAAAGLTRSEPAATGLTRAAAPAPAALPGPAQRRAARHRGRVLLAASSAALAAAALLVIARPAPGVGSGVGPDARSDVGSGTGPGARSDVGSGTGPGVGSGAASGVGPGTSAGSGVRRKGAASVAVFIQHQGVMRPGHSGDVVHPGDALQLAYSTAEPVHLAVLGRDQAGITSIYFAAGERAAAMAPGEQVPLPGSIILDDTLGTEALYALLCEDAVAVEPARQALERDGSVPAMPGCAIEELRFEKRAP